MTDPAAPGPMPESVAGGSTPPVGPVVAGTHELTAEWLTGALAGRLGGATVTAVDVQPVGTGQVSDSVRLTVTYDRPVDLPATFVAKVPAASEASRMAARTVRTYEIEAAFYAQLAGGLTAHLPACYHAAYDPEPDHYVVLLEDLSPAEQGDQLGGITVDQAAAAIDELAAVHAAYWGDPALAGLPWLNRSTPEALAFTAEIVSSVHAGFAERYADRLDAATLGLIARFMPRLGGYLSHRDGDWTLTHGDFRADNLLFGGARVAVLDWQTCAYGPGLADLAYLLGSSLTVEDRRAHEEGLVRRYHQALAAHGVELSWDDCWTGYRRYAFSGVVMTVGASMLVERTDRGDEMFAAMATRHVAHVLDLAAEELLS
ncbi:MAG TPA: phosphotransferase [Streptosporangiaceae bacterium]